MLSDLDDVILARRYRLGHPIGRGGMGTVYLGHHIALDRPVAIKVLESPPISHAHQVELGRPQVLSRAVARFLREAQLAAKVRHRNIVDIYDFGSTPDGLVYIVMEALTGRDLRAIVREPHAALRGWRWTFDVMRQVCAGVEAIHRVGVVHRDLKASNCFLVEHSGQVKLLDFGIARGIDGAKTEHPTDVECGESVVGTPEYMAPEQIRGAAPDRRTDVYAAGILLIELLTGRPPFVGRTAEEVFDRQLHDPPPPVDRLELGPRGLDRVLARALAKAPRNRFQSIAELAAALRRLDSAAPRFPV